MTLIKKNVFWFLHGIHNFDFLSFCKFPFGSNLGAKISEKIQKNAQQHVRIPIVA